MLYIGVKVEYDDINRASSMNDTVKVPSCKFEFSGCLMATVIAVRTAVWDSNLKKENTFKILNISHCCCHGTRQYYYLTYNSLWWYYVKVYSKFHIFWL